MVTNEEQRFLDYWKVNRTKQKSFYSLISLGMPIGILIGIGMLLNLMTGWYERANMVANGQSTPLVLVIAIVIIAVFCSIFFKYHQWDRNEQRYLEIIKREEKKSSVEKQQDEPVEGQS